MTINWIRKIHLESLCTWQKCFAFCITSFLAPWILDTPEGCSFLWFDTFCLAIKVFCIIAAKRITICLVLSWAFALIWAIWAIFKLWINYYYTFCTSFLWLYKMIIYICTCFPIIFSTYLHSKDNLHHNLHPNT